MIKYFRTFSATAFQIVFNQILGLFFFVSLASLLSKDVFGDLNWAVAVSYTITIMLTFGFDHVCVRRIAAGNNASIIAGVYFTHTVILSTFVFLLLVLHFYFFPGFHHAHQLLFIILSGNFFTLISYPFRQLANGRQRFWHLAWMNISGNFIKVLGIIFLFFAHLINAKSIGILFFISGVGEWIIAVFSVQHILGTRLKLIFDTRTYKRLFSESLPQLGVVLFESSFARIDWILMGLLSTNIYTADYSFSYKAFDSSRILLLIIAPVLLPKVAAILSKGNELDMKNKNELNKLWKLESIVAVIIPLLLNVAWIDMVNLVTKNNYGESTRIVYGILSVAIPMLYITNFYWTILFSQKRILDTLKISAIVTITNLILNVVLIKYFNAVGAAISSTLSLFLQMVLYRVMIKKTVLKTRLSDFLKTTLMACFIIYAMEFLQVFWVFKIFIAIALYLSAVYLSGLLNDFLPQRYLLKFYFTKKK